MAKAKSNNISEYGNTSITALKGADRVRKRPAVIFGSDGLEGCEHSAFEILSNAVDEAREGYGNEIIMTVYSDNSLEVEDKGRGIPLDYNEKEGRYNWDLIFCELYAGGKYDNDSDFSSYQYSLGLNGLGACATQYSSEYMNVISRDGENVYEINFKKGNVDGDLTKREAQGKEKKSGTIIKWKPDLEVFTDINIPREYFSDMLHRQSVVNSGIKFILRYQTAKGFETEEYLYENGIIDYVSEIVGDTALTSPGIWKTETSGKDRVDKKDYKLKAEVSFCVSNHVNMLEYYHNSSFLEHGGSPEKAVKTAFVYSVDKYLRSKEKYNKNESKITFADIQDCLVLVTNSFSTQTSYENQTKKAITNTFIADALTEFLKKNLEIYFIENPIEADKLCSQALINKRSRESAENARIKVKVNLTQKIDIANKVEKFVNCRSKDPEKRELFIVEGDSARSACVQGRDSNFQAIMPVRGKTLNCLKVGYDRIFKSDIIVDLLKVIGCGVELDSRIKADISRFDMSALKWNKIIICTDADEDGFQIRTLLLTLFYRLIPSLIKNGKIYIAETPLFEITCKGKSYFAYDEFEKQDIVQSLGNEKFTLQRSKGLGENEPDMMWQTTMSPATRRLIRVSEADAYETARIFDTLLGEDLAARKEFITVHGPEYVKDADI